MENLIRNPSAELRLDGWDVYENGGPTGWALSRTQDAARFGDYSFMLSGGTAGGGGTVAGIVYSGDSVGVPVAPGDVCNIIAHVLPSRAVYAIAYLVWLDLGGAWRGDLDGEWTLLQPGRWNRVVAEGLVIPEEAASALVIVAFDSPHVGDVHLLDGVAVTKGEPVGYFDGDSNGATWNGPPHASTSTRDPAYYSPVASDRLASLLTHRQIDGDDENNAILDALVKAIAYTADRLARIGYGDPDTGAPGGRVLTDPRVAPAWAIAHAAMYVGAVIPGRRSGESPDDWLTRVRDAAAFPFGVKRGSHEAVRRAVQPLLSGTKTIIIADDFGGPYDLLVRTITSETPDPDAVRLALEGDYYSGGRRGAIRAELKLTHVVADSVTFAEATRAFDAVADGVTAENVTREDVT